jgi:carbonic anhydrase
MAFKMLAFIITGIQRVRVEGTEFEATDEFTFKLQDLLPHDLDHFWCYQGSLTSPGPEPNDCFEVVMWTVFKVLFS